MRLLTNKSFEDLFHTPVKLNHYQTIKQLNQNIS